MKGKRNHANVAKFSAATAEPPAVARNTPKVDIRGGNYKATIGPDGWAIFRNIPVMGPVPKGEKGAPEDIGPSWMKKSVGFSLSDYDKGNYAAPIHKGHHKSLSIEDPEFLGFFLPKEVGTASIEGKSEPAVLADIKLKPSAFEAARRGELPFLSPEVDWSTGQFMSLSFLDSNPPHFKFPIFTVGEVTTDSTAKFEAALKAPAAFGMASCCKHCSAYQSKHGRPFEEGSMDPKTGENSKPSATPVEPNTATMGATAGSSTTLSGTPANVKFEIPPEFAARFAALEDTNAALKKRLDAEDAAKASKELEAKALEDLRGYQIGEATKAQIAEFAKFGKDRLDKFVASVKELAPKEPPRSMGEFLGQSISAADPVLAKFQGNPAELEVARRALAEHKIMTAKFKGYSVPADKHVELAVRAAKAQAVEGGN